MKTTPLIVRHRPKDLPGVVGQDHAVRALETVLEDGTARTFLFSGPSGTGKTTLARIVANRLGATDIMEVDGSTNTGIDSMRSVAQMSRQSSLSGSHRLIVVDECHGLSKQAWNSLLKILEEPGENTYWCLCTTEVTKVPKTVKTRCVHIELSPVPLTDLCRLLSRINKREAWDVPSSVIKVAAKKAGGSPRDAITNLAQVRDCETPVEASKMIAQEMERKEVIHLCRTLFQAQFKPGGTWKELMEILKDLEARGESPEGVRLALFGYFGSVVKNSDKPAQITFGLRVLNDLDKPIDSNEGFNRIVLCFGRILFL